MTEVKSIGEWIKGPFMCTTIEGFILNVSNDWCELVVKKIDNVGEVLPPRIKIGSVHRLPKQVIDTFYVKLNHEQQFSLIQTARMLGDTKWVDELIEQFYNPFSNETFNVEALYSSLFKKTIKLENTSKRRLFEFYQEAVERGLTRHLKKPEDINDTETLDIAIASIVLVSKNPQGIDYVRSLVNKS